MGEAIGAPLTYIGNINGMVILTSALFAISQYFVKLQKDAVEETREIFSRYNSDLLELEEKHGIKVRDEEDKNKWESMGNIEPISLERVILSIWVSYFICALFYLLILIPWCAFLLLPGLGVQAIYMIIIMALSSCTIREINKKLKSDHALGVELKNQYEKIKWTYRQIEGKYNSASNTEPDSQCG